MVPDAKRRSHRLASTVAVAVVVGAGLAGCGTAIAQTRTTQLSLFCLVHEGSSRATVYGLVGRPTHAGAPSAAPPALLKSLGVPFRAGAGRSWAAWTGPTTYVVTFVADSVVEVDRRVQGRTELAWQC